MKEKKKKDDYWHRRLIKILSRKKDYGLLITEFYKSKKNIPPANSSSFFEA